MDWTENISNAWPVYREYQIENGQPVVSLDDLIGWYRWIEHYNLTPNEMPEISEAPDD